MEAARLPARNEPANNQALRLCEGSHKRNNANFDFMRTPALCC